MGSQNHSPRPLSLFTSLFKSGLRAEQFSLLPYPLYEDKSRVPPCKLKEYSSATTFSLPLCLHGELTVVSGDQDDVVLHCPFETQFRCAYSVDLTDVSRTHTIPCQVYPPVEVSMHESLLSPPAKRRLISSRRLVEPSSDSDMDHEDTDSTSDVSITSSSASFVDDDYTSGAGSYAPTPESEPQTAQSVVFDTPGGDSRRLTVRLPAGTRMNTKDSSCDTIGISEDAGLPFAPPSTEWNAKGTNRGGAGLQQTRVDMDDSSLSIEGSAKDKVVFELSDDDSDDEFLSIRALPGPPSDFHPDLAALSSKKNKDSGGDSATGSNTSSKDDNMIEWGTDGRSALQSPLRMTNSLPVGSLISGSQSFWSSVTIEDVD